MRRLARGLAALLVSGGVMAQSPTSPGVPPGMPNPHAMMKAMEAAQAAARQPGDDALSCAQLEAKVIAAMQDEAYQAHMQRAALAAQKDFEATQTAKSDIAAKSAATAAATLPGASMAHMMASAAENQAKVAQGQVRLQEKMMHTQKSMRFLPLIFRAQRLIELGLLKQCEWAASAAGGMDFPGLPPKP